MNTYASAAGLRKVISSVRADRVVLAHELVQAAVPEQAVPVLGDVARAIGSDDPAAAIRAALRLRREVATGVPVSGNVDHVVQAFDRWLLVDLSEIQSSW